MSAVGPLLEPHRSLRAGTSSARLVSHRTYAAASHFAFLQLPSRCTAAGPLGGDSELLLSVRPSFTSALLCATLAALRVALLASGTRVLLSSAPPGAPRSV